VPLPNISYNGKSSKDPSNQKIVSSSIRKQREVIHNLPGGSKGKDRTKVARRNNTDAMRSL